MTTAPSPTYTVEQLENEAWDVYSKIEQVSDVLDRAKYQTAMVDAFRNIVKQLSDDRREDLHTLNKEHGYSYGVLSEELKMTRGRIQQLITGITSPKRPGVIEMDAKLTMATLEAKGASMDDMVKELVPRIQAHRGGDRFTAERIASILNVNTSVVEAEMRSLKSAS